MRWIAGEDGRRASLEAAIAALERDEGVTWVRHRATRRRLARVDLADGPVLLKHFLAPTRHRLRERWKRRLGLSGAEREWRALVALRRAGVAVPAPLAHVELASGEQVVAMEWVDGAPLDAALAGAAPARRRALLAGAGALVRALHAAGFTHRDLHRENLLVAADGPRLIDLQGVLRLAPAPLRRRDLGELDHSLRPTLSLADRVRLRAAALGVTRPFDRAARAALRRVGLASIERSRAHVRSRAARSLRPGRRAQPFHWLHGRGLISAGANAQPVREALTNDGQGSPLTLRRFAGRWSDPWRGSLARRAWHVAHALEACGVPCARPLAYLEWRRFGLPVGGSALVLEPAPIGARPDDAARQGAVERLRARLREMGFETSRLDPEALAFDRRGARVEARIASPEQLDFPAR